MFSFVRWHCWEFIFYKKLKIVSQIKPANLLIITLNNVWVVNVFLFDIKKKKDKMLLYSFATDQSSQVTHVTYIHCYILIVFLILQIVNILL